MNEIKVVGNYMPSNHDASRIVCDEGVAPTVKENHGTVTGVRQRINYNKGVKNMWKNNLEKLNFDMEEIRIFDAFFGIGSLHKSLTKLGVPTRISSSSEVDIDTIISYSGIHIENFKDLEFEYPSEEQMRAWLIDRKIGYDFEKGKSKIPRLKKDKLKLLYKGSYILNNLGDISSINPDDMEDFDIFNLSFCCQDISNAGKQKGLKNTDGTPTRSGLIVPSLKLARAKKPKYIVIENVKALIQKKFIDDFYDIINELNEMGYNCYYPTKEDKKGFKPTCLNSKNFGIPQNRERIFVYAIRKDVDTFDFEFNYGYDMGIRLKDILENEVDEKYYLNKQWHFSTDKDEKHDQNEIAQIDGISYKAIRSVGDPEKLCRTLDTMGGGQREPKVVINGAIRGRYNEYGKIEQQLELRSDGVTNSLITVEKDNIIKDEYRIRKLTPLECWRLQGFDDEDFYKAKELGISDSQLYKQAGNSITVNVLYYQFKNLFKKYIIE